MSKIGFKTDAVKLKNQQLVIYDTMQEDAHDPLVLAMREKGLEEAVNLLMKFLQSKQDNHHYVGAELKRIKDRWFAPF